ncbi:hypothetical protein Tco_1010961 [Tanacetum coccineum]
MNPKTLSLTSSFTPIHHLKPISKKLHHNSGRVKPICTSQPDIEISVQGTGAAAPTRGDIFLEKQQQIQSLVVEKKKKIKKKKELVKPVVTAGGVSYCCYGCGAPLQVVEIDAPGFVDPDTYQLVLLLKFVYFLVFSNLNHWFV